ncbi:hypothetical protein ABTC93_20025, partial [Acinetobacter baumannii]
MNKDYRLEFHIDTDEANAAGLRTGMDVELIANPEAEESYQHLRLQERQMVLVLNCGSSSVKYKLYEMPARKLIASEYLEQIKRD